MTAISPAPPPRRPTATAAFLRGVHRRASLLAWLQCGDGRQGAAAVSAAGRAFAAEAADRPMEQWPVAYWGLLLAQPQLRTTVADPRREASLAWLGDLAGPVRAILLLRLVARLEVDEIAAALAVPGPAVHAALREALPRQADGSHDPVAWQARQEALRRALEALPASPAEPPDVPAPPPAASRGPVRTLLWVGVVACVLALAATFWPWRMSVAPGDGTVADGVPLPPSQATPVEVGPDLALLAHPDLEQIAAAGDASIVRDLGFYAWYAARMADQPDGSQEAGDAP